MSSTGNGSSGAQAGEIPRKVQFSEDTKPGRPAINSFEKEGT